MKFSKKEIVNLISIILMFFMIISLFFIYLFSYYEEKIEVNWLLVLLGSISLSYLYVSYRMIRGYLIKNKRYDFVFYLINEEQKEIAEMEFLVYPETGNKALIDQENFLKPVSSQTGKVIIPNLSGGIYRLALRDSPRKMLGEFGVKNLSQKKMNWYKTTSDSIEVEKKRRLWFTLKV